MAEVKLTEQQTRIGEHKDGSLIVLAGAGSGKTATLVQRVGRLIDKGVSPRQILMITFSRKAAREISARVERQFGLDGSDVVVDTFHGFGYRFLRQHKDLFGLGEDMEWVILNENDQKRLLNEIGAEFAEKSNFDVKLLRKALKQGFALWSLMKQNGICPGNVSDALIGLEKARCSRTGDTPNHERVQLVDRLVAETLVQYERDKRKSGYLDFDDLLILPTKALKRYPDIARALSFQHQYIMVDESQDTNAVQYWMVKEIAQHHKNLVMVGDDDQGIYTWRGARVANLKRFIKDFNAPIAKLERNFRSHSRIVECASKLIRHNKSRLPKTAYSEDHGGDFPQFCVAQRDREMAENIVREVKARQAQGVPLSDMAVLYRTNRMTMILEPALKQAGIPYTVVGGMSFYERKEIQAITAVVRVAHRWKDWQAIKALQPYIDGLGKKGMNDLIQKLDEYDENLLGFAVHKAPQQYGKGGIVLQTFLISLFEAAYSDTEGLPQYKILERIVQWAKDGPMKLLDREKDDAIRVKRSENLDLLLHEVRLAKPDDYFQYLMEGPISDYQDSHDQGDYLTLSTIHRSKGLEWPHVMVAGFSNGLMPLDTGRMNGRPAANTGENKNKFEQDDEDDGGRPEEERRLAYVAITRAAQSLSLHHASLYHFPGGEPVVVEPSPYLEEMGLELSPQQAAIISNALDTEQPLSYQSDQKKTTGAAQSPTPRYADDESRPALNILG
ncbi:DNA helicase UvrD [Marinobacter lutaoensis]|uniref:DNA 3'-5' helicase n=1 Tax=Marinobacter lutaoensis TaxID=135739 RepID=A0A1V2DPN9_9GAMM|nr:ATP-dependent helicase [Marinobacter lutaoensis]ONF42628.1 DNA helicase UvrD [Marinobacter lutaoensis]